MLYYIITAWISFMLGFFCCSLLIFSKIRDQKMDTDD